MRPSHGAIAEGEVTDLVHPLFPRPRPQLPQNRSMPSRRALLSQAHQASVFADYRNPQHVPSASLLESRSPPPPLTWSRAPAESRAHSGVHVEPALAAKGRAASRPEPEEQPFGGRDAAVLRQVLYVAISLFARTLALLPPAATVLTVVRPALQTRMSIASSSSTATCSRCTFATMSATT